MKIGLLPLAAGRKAGGPETYEVELIRSLAVIDQHNEYFVYCTSPGAEETIGVKQENIIFRSLRPSARSIALSVTLPLQMLRDGVNLLHCTYAPPPLSFSPYDFTLHCTSNLVRPDFYDRAKVFRLNALQKMGLKRARHIMCVSGFIRDYIVDHFSVEAERTGVVYNGVGSLFRRMDGSETRSELLKRFGIDYPYFLYVGKLQARKNVKRLIHAFARYKQEVKSDVRLVLAGPKTETSEGIDETIAELGIEQNVVQLGYVNPPNVGGSIDLPLLYNGCRIFILPSLYEGFGIPLIEAMACGAPTITSNVTCLPEVAGGAALLVDPLSVDSIAEALVQLDGEEDLRSQLIERGTSRAAEFSWDRCARETLTWYERGVAV